MASGLLLSDSNKQQLTGPLDAAIRRAMGSYVFNRDAGCGLSDGRWQYQNTCMDDYAIAATAFAWIAAYKLKRGDSGVSYYSDAAKNAINSALSLEESVCAYPSGTNWSPSSARGPCTGTVDNLRTGAAETVSLNHGQQTIAYGMGLMTSISSAFIGLQTAQAGPSLTQDQKDIALALFKEAQAQNHTVADGSTFVAGGCYALKLDLTGFQTIAHCGDVNGAYKPKMFPVNAFYRQFVTSTLPTAGYQFDIFDPDLFVNPFTGVFDPFFNNGRFVIYRDLTQCWWSSPLSLGPTVPPPPTSEIAWIKPSYASWGPANTLTVAGYARNGPSGVELHWRDVMTGEPEQVVSFQPTPDANGVWSNTIPTSNYCHDYEVYVNYSNSSSNRFMYSGIGSGYCPENARLDWIQPQWSAGFGPPGSLVVQGHAANAPAGTLVKLYWRDLSLASSPWNLIDFAAPVGSDGAWFNSIANVDYSHVYEVYARYDAFASRPIRYNGNQLFNAGEINFAAPSAGGTVTASSTYSAGYPVSAVNNGDRKGINWGNGGGWNDATPDSYPDWVQVDFNSSKTIDQINVFTLQDNYPSPIEPVEALTFSAYGLTNFNVDYWDSSAGTWKRVPGANAVSNNKVWTRFLFSALTTTKIRVNITGALASFSRITEIEAWGVPPSKFNYASKVTNGVRTSDVIASSTYNAGYPGAAVINGDRKGVNWASGGGWNDATADTFPDSLEIDFRQQRLDGTFEPVARSIDTINVFTLQDNYGSPADPSESMSFTTWGITAFEVQYFDGSNWVTVPGGNVSGNTQVWRKFTFSPVITTKIRVVVNSALGSYSRITEVEALGF